MPITSNGVQFSEAVPDSPRVAFDPQGESRLEMAGWFSWDDIESLAAFKGFLGFSAVATDWPGQVGKKFLSRSGWAGNLNRGANPFAHPDFPNQMYLASSYRDGQGWIPNSPAAGPRGTAQYDEGRGVLSFTSARDGYRVLDDSLVVDVNSICAPACNRVPTDAFCLRNMEIVEQMASWSLSVPPLAGLYYSATVGNIFMAPVAVALGGRVMLYEGDITITWWPVPLNAWNEAAWANLYGKTNHKPFPPPPGVGGAPASLLVPKAARTLVAGLPEKKLIRMGDGNWAYKVKLRFKWFPFGANSFYWPNPPAAVGPPGYYPTQVGTRALNAPVLFQDADYTAPFAPPP